MPLKRPGIFRIVGSWNAVGFLVRGICRSNSSQTVKNSFTDRELRGLRGPRAFRGFRRIRGLRGVRGLLYFPRGPQVLIFKNRKSHLPKSINYTSGR